MVYAGIVLTKFPAVLMSEFYGRTLFFHWLLSPGVTLLLAANLLFIIARPDRQGLAT